MFHSKSSQDKDAKRGWISEHARVSKTLKMRVFREGYFDIFEDEVTGRYRREILAGIPNERTKPL